jgi:phage FluMu protein Com
MNQFLKCFDCNISGWYVHGTTEAKCPRCHKEMKADYQPIDTQDDIRELAEKLLESIEPHAIREDHASR